MIPLFRRLTLPRQGCPQAVQDSALHGQLFEGTGDMTTQEILLWTCAYLVEFGVVMYFTRATARRVVGALIGGASAGLVGLGAIALCEALAWWQIPSSSTPFFLPLFYLGLAISLTPIYLVTWRLARRFRWRGLAVFIGSVAVIGPPRDYLIAATFPKWMCSLQASLLSSRTLSPT